jgi:uncharacterized coiled-coil DUF342 family protein
MQELQDDNEKMARLLKALGRDRDELKDHRDTLHAQVAGVPLPH